MFGELVPRLITQNRLAIIFTWLAITGVLGSGMAKIEITADNRVFYSTENERFADFRNFERTYLPNNNILLVIHSNDELDEQKASALRWLDTNSWQIPKTLRVESLASYPVVANSQSDLVEIEPLLDTICPLKGNCKTSSDWIDAHPEIIGRLSDKSGRALAVVLTLDVQLGTTDEIGDISENVANLKQTFQNNHPNYQIIHTGGVAMMQAFAEASEDDTSMLLPIAMAGILATCWAALGSIRLTLLLLALGATAAASSMGLAGHLGLTLNTATSVTAIVVFTVVVASSMHIVVSYMNDCSLYDRNTASENALIVNSTPIAIATLTSVAGFLSLLYADAPPLNELGALSAFGIFIGGIQSVTVAAAILPKIPPPKNSTKRISDFSEWLARDRGPTQLAILTVMLVIILVVGLSRLAINDDFVAYFDERYPFRIETDRIEQLIASPNHIEIDIDSGDVDGVYNTQYITFLEELMEYLADQQVVANAFGYLNILDKVSEITSAGELTTSPEELAQLFLVYELSLSEGQSTSDFVTTDKRRTRISVLLNRSDSKQINQLKRNIETWASSRRGDYDVTVTGENIPVANLTSLNAENMAAGIASSIALASILIALVYKSWLLGLIGFTAILLPILGAFGVWGLAFGEIGLAAVIVVSITLGIVIDDAIHLLSRYRAFCEQPDRTSIEAANLAVRVVGSAIVVTSLALMAGFAALATSGFGINAALGICTVLVIGLSLVIDLIFVPAVIRKLPLGRPSV